MADRLAPAGAPPHSRCADLLRADMAPAEVTVSTAGPIVDGLFAAEEGVTCPHGVVYWIEPTGEQLLRWRAEAGR